jgi:hypothetical protein
MLINHEAMTFTELLKNNPDLATNLTVSAKASDLQEFAKICIEAGRSERPEPQAQEEYLTSQQFAEALQVSLVTLWAWDKKGITKPLYVGNLKRYRRSDLEKILCENA